MKTLYEHAWVLTMDEEMHAYRDGWLLTDGADIAAVGEGRRLRLIIGCRT